MYTMEYYKVIKNEDIQKYLTAEEKRQLVHILVNISSGRRADGKNPENTYYICNTDEPYADKVLDVIIRGEE